jgi:decaprenyl-phosphate phosphoribosyltransferase
VLLALLQSLRPRQWIKNLFVGIPLMYSLRLNDPTSLLITAGAIFLFCLLSGCVYILNDLVDVEKDRAHPKKRHRAIPSGRLPEPVARRFAVICVPVCLALGYWLEPWYAAVLAGYFLLNVAYSFKLKQVAYVDVLCIAAGFMLRVLAGALALQVPASPWLLACTGLLAMFLGFGKRAHELSAASDPHKQRAALAAYDLKTLRVLMYVVGLANVALYVAYTLSEHVLQLFGTNKLAWTSVLAVVGIFRFIYLATTRHEAESPTEEMLKDPLFMLNAIALIAVTAAILYGWL